MDALTNTTLSGGDGEQVRPQSKLEAFLEALLAAGKRGLNTFQANKVYGDTCLHSGISELRNKLRFLIADKWEQVPCRTGHSVRVKRYWLANPKTVELTKKIIDSLRTKRGLSPKYHQPLG